MYSEFDISFFDYKAARRRLCLAVKSGERLRSLLSDGCWELAAALTTFNAANEAAPTSTGSGARQVFEPARPGITL
jgi:hypothetical protein